MMKNKPKYIFIDDEIKQIESVVEQIVSQQKVDIESIEVANFDEQISYLSQQQGIDGFIFDLRLDGSQQSKAKYQASTLAQQYRNLVTEGKVVDVPIILCSSEERIKLMYKDFTSHDLFDYSFLKIPKDSWKIISLKLYSLSEGYKKIKSKGNDWVSMLEIDGESIDKRIFSKFENRIEKKFKVPAHEYARHVIKELLEKTGPLIKEEILAARLGVDIEKSSQEEWDKVKYEVFGSSKYTGVFSDAWECWWMDDVNNIFEKRISGGKPLASMEADERLNLVNKYSKVALVFSEVIEKSSSKRYWTICEGTKKPLDSREGFRVAMDNEPEPWQEYEYISFYAAAERIGKDKGISVHPSDLKRLNMLKKVL